VAPVRRDVRQPVREFVIVFLFLYLKDQGYYAWRPGALWLTCLVLGALAAGLVLATPARRVHPEPMDAEAGSEFVR
jgi:hypothetical protein